MSTTNQKTIEILLKLNDQMGAQLSLQTANMKEAANAADKLAGALKQESLAQSVAKKEAKEASDAMKLQSAATEKNKGSFTSTLGTIATLAAAYISLSSAVHLYSSAASYIAEVGGNFEQAMANTRAILQPTAEEFAALSYSAKDLGATTVFTAAEAGNAYTELGKVGFTTAQILASGNDVLNLAVAANLGIADAATAASTVVRQFGLTAGQTGEAVDIMTKAFSISSLDASNFTEAMQYVGPVARQANVSLSEASAALGVLADEGVRGSMAGTSLRRIIVVLGDSSSTASKQIAKFHPEAKTLTEKMAALGEMGMGTTEAMKLFRIEASTGATILANSGTKVREYGDALNYASGNTKGFAERVAAIQMDTFQGDLKNVSSGLENVAITFAQAFGPMARDSVQFLNTKLDELTKWAENNPAELQKWAQTADGLFRMVIAGAEKLGTALRVVNNLASMLLPSQIDTTGISQFQILTDDAQKLKLGLDELTISKKNSIEADNQAKYQYDGERIAAKENIKFLEDSITQRNLAIAAKKKEMSVAIDALEVEKRVLDINRSSDVKDIQRLNTLNNSIPIMKRARDELKSYSAVQIETAKAKADALKAEGAKTEIKARGTGKVSDIETITEADKKAAEQYAKAIESDVLLNTDGTTRIVLANEKKWEAILKIDRDGGAKHIKELEDLRDRELEMQLYDYKKKNPASEDTRTLDSRGLPSMHTGGASANEASIKALQNAKMQQTEAEHANALLKILQDRADHGFAIENQKYADELTLLESQHLSTELLTKEHKERLAQIETESNQSLAARILSIDQKTLDTKMTLWSAEGAAASQFAGGMAALLEATAGKSKARLYAARTLAIAQIGIDTAVSIMKTLASPDLPVPLAIAASVGIAATGTAQALKVSNIKFAQGQYSPDASFGLVPGTSYSGDNVLAHVNSGERILSAQQNQAYESKQSASITFHYSPVYNVEVSDIQKRKDLRMAQRQMKSIETDPEYYTTQAAI